MKKLIIIALLTTSTAQAGMTSNVKRPFIANGGFHGLCDRLGWQWGWYGTGRACFSDRYLRNNGLVYDKASDSFKSK